MLFVPDGIYDEKPCLEAFHVKTRVIFRSLLDHRCSARILEKAGAGKIEQYRTIA